MKENAKKALGAGLLWLTLFAAWTWMICTVDVQSVGQSGTEVGLAGLNGWFHACTGVHMTLYHITDWLGLVPLCICLVFGGLGCLQWMRRRRLLKVDADILLLGVYDLIVIGAYLAFEMMPVNYRPVLIEGRLEASYPSSTTLLVLSVMPTLAFQVRRRWKSAAAQKTVCMASGAFSAFMVLGRLISGVHWLTDIAGAVLLSRGLFSLYRAAVLVSDQKEHGGSLHGIP